MPHCSPTRNAENRSCPSWRRPRLRAHPGGTAEFSAADDIVDDALAAVARDLGASRYASVTFAGSKASPVVTARLCRLARRDAHTGPPSARFKLVDAIRVAGHALQLMLPLPKPHVAGAPAERSAPDGNTFDRRVRMLGAAGQRTLAAMRTAKIGMGGTGSAVARPARRRKASSAGLLSLSQLGETDDIGMTRVMGK